MLMGRTEALYGNEIYKRNSRILSEPKPKNPFWMNQPIKNDRKICRHGVHTRCFKFLLGPGFETQKSIFVDASGCDSFYCVLNLLDSLSKLELGTGILQLMFKGELNHRSLLYLCKRLLNQFNLVNSLSNLLGSQKCLYCFKWVWDHLKKV